MIQGITKDMSIEDIIDTYPTAIKVFIKHCLHCIGCPISHHHSIADCAAENDLDLDALLVELNASIPKE